MGLYLNPDNQVFENIVNSGDYVDKTGLISYMNNCMGKTKHLIASSRPRRFGKSMAVHMLTAYYSRNCDSKELFAGLEIEKDDSFFQHLNKYDVICLDIQWLKGVAVSKIKDGLQTNIIKYIQTEVISELKKFFKKYVSDDETVLASALASINNATGTQFIIIIDEWDCFFREDKDDDKLLEEYITFLRSLFKGGPADKFVKLAYITGILPIKKYGTQSALNNFRELTMSHPNGIARYIGFTESEVKNLCKKYNMPFTKMKKWYDGYTLDRVGHIYSPNSVMEAIHNEEFQDYWSRTETYEVLKTYIVMDFCGLKNKIIDMLGGERCSVDINSFQNDMTTFNCADDVLTLLIHLGYLSYDKKSMKAFIPNEEVRSAFMQAIKTDGWEYVYKAINDSEALLKATLEKREDAVAEMIQDIHMLNVPSLVYNNEISLASVIRLAYYSAVKDYNIIREMAAGNGFADMVFIPKRGRNKPAILVELKWNKSADTAITQIENKNYPKSLVDYAGNMLLVGINYDKKTRKHKCRIMEG